MAQEIQAIKKVYLTGTKATPAPPLGTSLQSVDAKAPMVAKKFNEVSKDRAGETIPTIITCYKGGEFDLKLMQEPVANCIKKLLPNGKGSGEPNKNKVGKLTKEQVRKLAEDKFIDMNASSIETAMRMVEGQARSMGVEIEE